MHTKMVLSYNTYANQEIKYVRRMQNTTISEKVKFMHVDMIDTFQFYFTKIVTKMVLSYCSFIFNFVIDLFYY